MTIRKVLVVLMAVPFVSLCLHDLTHGRPRTGVAAGLLAVINTIIYWG